MRRTLVVNLNDIYDRVLARLAEGDVPTAEGLAPSGSAYQPLEETDAVAAADAVIDGRPAAGTVIDDHLARLAAVYEEGTRQAAALTEQAQAIIDAHQPRRPARLHRTVPTAVQQRARVILDQRPAPVVLDLETTGLSPKTGRIIEAAVMDIEGHILCQFRLNPGGPIPAQSTAVHGITDQQVADLPTWAQVGPVLRAYLASRTVIAHYAKFEAKFIPADWGITWVCTKVLADEAFGQYDWSEARGDWRKSGSLENRLRQCGLEPGPAHTAGGDCLSTLRLIRQLAGYETI